MAKTNNYLTTIAIDTVRSTIHFYSSIENDDTTITHSIKHYSGRHFDEEFFKKFREAIKEFVEENPSDTMRKVTVVLPDTAILTDTLKIPTIKGFGQMKKAFEASLGVLYKNYRDLRISSYAADQNKQYSTFVISAVQNNILSEIYSACAENKLVIETLTYASGATVGAASVINSKLKNASYLFLDIKDVYSRFTFVIGGRAVGFYTVPFGFEFLRTPRVIGEDMLFDHSLAELAVINARERAKSKKLTVMEDEEDEEDLLPIDAEEGAAAMAESETLTVGTQKVLKKTPRKLPKFMLRDLPETEEGIAYENFRVFMKWALTLIDSNKKITDLGKLEYVCVNLPEDLAGVVAKANEESAENGILFTRLKTEGIAPLVTTNLDLYGGLFPRQINPAVKF